MVIRCSECGRIITLSEESWKYQIGNLSQCGITCHRHAKLRLLDSRERTSKSFIKDATINETMIFAQGKVLVVPIFRRRSRSDESKCTVQSYSSIRS